MQAVTVQLLAVLMGAAQGLVWVLGSRWGHPGRTARLRAGLPPPPAAVRGGYVALAFPLLYPPVMVIAPSWAYAGWLNWSSPIDVALQGAGLGLWAAGMFVLVWAARILGRYLSVDGVAEDHELVASGPFRYVRHPVYGAFTAITVGLALVFRSYLLVAAAAAWVAAGLWWAAEEEVLLASPEGLGEAYRIYSEQTGRFIPRMRQSRR